MRQRGEPGAQHLMRGEQRHPLFEGFRRIEPAGVDVGQDILMDMLKIGKLLIEMARQQQRDVGVVALGDADRAFAILERQIGSAKRDRQHERSAAHDQPLDRAHPRAYQRARFR